MTGPSISRRSLLRGGAVGSIAALAGIGAVAAAGPSTLPVPDGPSHQDVATVRPAHRDAAIEHLRSLVERAAPIVERAREAGVFEGERFLGYEGSVSSATEFLDTSHPATFDTISTARYHVNYVAETFGVAVASLDDVTIGPSGPAQTGRASDIDALSESIRYESNAPAETMVWIDLIESWLHVAMIAGRNAEVDREALSAESERVRNRALARAVRNHERSVRFLSDARQFYRTFRARQSSGTSLGLDAARRTYREQIRTAAHDHEWYDERRVDEETPRDTAWNRLLTLAPGERSLDDAEWARRDGLAGLETVQLAEAAAQFRGFATGKERIERLRGNSTVPRRLLFDTKRRAVDGAYRIATAGDAFERWLLGRAAMYLSKGDRFLTDGEILDNYPRAHALACYGTAVGVVDTIPSVAGSVTR
ncbi:hypothetical protein [Halobellus ordinarius]|uniref:hypothetical protein n=1 Tax=Halobellus ordinarius TaxID=3075120 RepID=UPI00288088C6|nr:hypothetical protein [Halobellus sp. ZY16]